MKTTIDTFLSKANDVTGIGWLLLLPLFLILFTTEQSVAQDGWTPDLIPYALFHDFETGELFAWEPYPYQQDIGYDALYFTWDSPTYNDSNYALARPVTANHTTELYQGFTRQLNFWTTEETRLQAAVFFQSDRDPDTLEITLGTFDGDRYRHTIEEPASNEWIELDIPIDRFQLEDGHSLESGEHIQVVTLEGAYPVVYYLFTYTMLMDNFQINGKRQRRFVSEKPASDDFAEFDTSVLTRHYTEGETLSLNVRPEENVTLNNVSAQLVDGRGDIVKNDIRFDFRDGLWENKSIYTFGENDARGRWKIELEGERPNGSVVEWEFQFLMPGEPIDEYPRLFFSAEELNEKLEDESSPAAQRILENALSDRSFMDIDLDEVQEGVDIPTESFTFGPWAKYRQVRIEGWRPPLYTLRDVIRDGSFHYAFNDDREAGERAREALIKLSEFNEWNAGWMIENKFWTYYPLGYVLQSVAIGYDLLHDLLSDEEKELVRGAIKEKALKPFYRDMVVMNRMPSHATNHLSVLVSGYGMAATAIYGEDPVNPWMEPWLSGILEKLEAFVNATYYEDGSYAEPIGYHGHATNNIVQIFDVLERNFGLDYSTATHVKNFYYMPIIGTSEAGQIQDFGDFNVGNMFDMAAPRSQWFVHRLGDPYLYDYVKPHWEAGRGGFFGYLWYRDDIEPVSREELSTSKVFDARGMIMRSGWESDAAIIHKHAGPNSNHYHYDQGSFQVQANGDELLTDPGIGYGGYYGNLKFPHYNMQAVGHNVMLVDGDPQSQKPAHYDNGVVALRDWPRVVHTFAGEIADAIESDLTTVYKEKLADYRRTLLYTKAGPLFLFDEVESASPEGRTYNWLFHAPMEEGFERTIEWRDNRMTVDRPNARLTMDVIEGRIDDARIVDNEDERHPESMLRLDSDPGLSEANFMAVLYPEARPEGGSYGERPSTDRIEADGWVGARVSLDSGTHYGVFRTSVGGGSSVAGTVAGFTTDAERFTASLDGSDRLARYYLEGSEFDGYGRSLRSDVPVTVAVLHHGSGTDLEVDASDSARLSISVDERPSRVSLAGESVRFSYDNGRVGLQVPAGRHDIEVR